MTKFHKGQQVFVHHYSGASYGLRQWKDEPDALAVRSVEKMGTKWATLSGPGGGTRVGLETGEFHEDDGYGRAYPTREAYAEAKATALAWDRLRVYVGGNYSPPEGLTAEIVAGFMATLDALDGEE
jgi:hypothetical protein